MKRCLVCLEMKARTEFSKHRSDCKTCNHVRQRTWYDNNKEYALEKSADRHYRRKYGLTKAQVEEMRQQQENKCAICFNQFAKTPAVDHCHTTGKVRGLLCRFCNIGLGNFNDDLCRIDAAAAYLKRFA